VLINLPGTTAAEDSDEDAEGVTNVDRSPADDELRLGWVLGFDLRGGSDGGGSDGGFSSVPVHKQTSISAMAERPREALYVFDQRRALFAKTCTKLHFAPPYGGIIDNISALSESFNAKKLCSRVSSREYQFYS